MLSFDCLIQIFWIKASSQFSILLRHDYHRADPLSRLCDWCEDGPVPRTFSLTVPSLQLGLFVEHAEWGLSDYSIRCGIRFPVAPLPHRKLWGIYV